MTSTLSTPNEASRLFYTSLATASTADTRTPIPSSGENATTPMFHDCRIVYKDFEYLPWANPDNIISLEKATAILKVVGGVILPLVSLVGIPANVVNALVFWKQGLRERINMLLFCLACADLAVVVYTFLYSVEYFYTLMSGRFLMTGPVATALTNNDVGIVYGFVYVSGFVSTTIALERCICITHPFTAKTAMRTKTAAIVVVLSAAVLVGVHSVVSVAYRIHCVYYPRQGLVLRGHLPSQFYLDHQFLVDILNGVVYGLALPVFFFFTTTVTTAITAVQLRAAARWRHGQGRGRADSREVGVTRMLVAVSGVFLACTLPNVAVRVAPFLLPGLRLGGRQQNLLLLGTLLLHACPALNSALNLPFYLRMGSRYRAALRALYCPAGSPDMKAAQSAATSHYSLSVAAKNNAE